MELRRGQRAATFGVGERSVAAVKPGRPWQCVGHAGVATNARVADRTPQSMRGLVPAGVATRAQMAIRAHRVRRLVAMACLVAAALAAACAPEAAPDPAEQVAGSDTAPRKEIIQPEGVARLPVFSSAVRSGNLIFLSGAIGALPGVSPPTLAAGGIIPETRQTMDNLGAVLEAAGVGWGDVIKCTVFLADMSDYATFNEVYLEYFPEDPPARSALAAAGLAFNARVEVECIAVAPEDDR